MSKKIRILNVGESPHVATGYAVYAAEIQQRLVATGDFEVAQLACYHQPAKPPPWTIYPNTPTTDQEREQVTHDPVANFGQLKFNETLLDFQPDIVWDIRDEWMLNFQAASPFRDLFRWVIMPPVDSIPQHEQWLATYAEADACLTYTDWGAAQLKREGGQTISLHGTASPGADFELFCPRDSLQIRQQAGFEPGPLYIVGTVMRNQVRKLYPNLISDFTAFLSQAPAQLADHCYLYLHTSFPDEGWDLPRLIKQSGIARRILVTYICHHCDYAFPNHYHDALTTCVRCGQHAASLPNVKKGVSREQLSRIINLFDLYVQYANCEGFGMPLVEAAACGVPVAAVDFSAMSDVVAKLQGDLIACDLQMDPTMGVYRAIPQRHDFVRVLLKFFGDSETHRHHRGRVARQRAQLYYNWDRAAAAWERVFRSLAGPTRWHQPSRLRSPRPIPSTWSSHQELVQWMLRDYLGRPDLSTGYLAHRMLRDLHWGVRYQALGHSYRHEESLIGSRSHLIPFAPDDLIREVTTMLAEFNHWETRRLERLS
jgi:glycosyltransferase involved in cell wall biosynthesis